MKVKQTPIRMADLIRQSLFLKGRRSVFLVLFFAGYTLLFAVAAFAAVYKIAPSYQKEAMMEQVRFYANPRNLFRLTGNYSKGVTAAPETFLIDIKHKHLQKLRYVRSVSLQRGLLYDSQENSVPATIRYNGQAYRVELGLKGRMNDHWSGEDMWSMKVRVKDGQTIMGMRVFGLLHPKTRNYLAEWIAHRFFKDIGLSGLRYRFVAVNINGKGSQVYAMEEDFDKLLVENNRLKEGPTFKFNRDSYWEFGEDREGQSNRYGLAQEFWGCDIAPVPRGQTLADPAQAVLFNKAKSLMEAFRENKLSTSQVFNVRKLALFFAMEDIIGSHHAISLDNARFYYCPITAQVELILNDSNHYEYIEPTGILGEEKQIGRVIRYSPRTRGWKLTAWVETLFKDPVFYREYIRALERVSDPAFLDSLFGRNSKEIEENLKILHRDYPAYDFTWKSILYDNQAYIRQVLHADKLLSVRYRDRPGQGEILLEVSNAQYLPVEIAGATLGDSAPLEILSAPELVQAGARGKSGDIYEIRLRRPAGFSSGKLPQKLILRSRILGSDRIVEDAAEQAAGD